jgi:hypothetical protein
MSSTAAEPNLLETYFLAEEKRTMQTQKLREKNNFQDLSARLPDISENVGFPPHPKDREAPRAHRSNMFATRQVGLKA